MSTFDRINELQHERLIVMKKRDDLAYNLRLIKSLRRDATPSNRIYLDKKHREALYFHAEAERKLAELKAEISRMNMQRQAEMRAELVRGEAA